MINLRSAVFTLQTVKSRTAILDTCCIPGSSRSTPKSPSALVFSCILICAGLGFDKLWESRRSGLVFSTTRLLLGRVYKVAIVSGLKADLPSISASLSLSRQLLVACPFDRFHLIQGNTLVGPLIPGLADEHDGTAISSAVCMIIGLEETSQSKADGVTSVVSTIRFAGDISTDRE